MWEKFNEAARKAIFYAQEDAGRFGQQLVSTEHLLLGLIREQDHPAVQMLADAGISTGPLRTEVERLCRRGRPKSPQDKKLSNDSKGAVDLAINEFMRLGDEFIGTEHLLIGLALEANGVGGAVMREMGADADVLRAALSTHRGEVWPPPIVGSAPTELPLGRLTELSIDQRLGVARIALGIALVFDAFTIGDIVYRVLLKQTTAFGTMFTPSPATVWEPLLLATFSLVQANAANRLDSARLAGRAEMAVSILLLLLSIFGLTYCIMTI